MSSFAYHLNKFTLQLDLAVDKGFQFNENKALVSTCDHPISKEIVLKNILSVLKEAPVTYLGQDPVIKFKASLDRYVNTAKQDEKNKVKTISTQILQMINQKGQNVWSCFQGDAARKINTILDKDIQNLVEKEYYILYDIANLLAYRRKAAHCFYQKSAIAELIQKLKSSCPNISIEYDEDGSWEPFITTELPHNLSDLQFLLFVQFHYQNQPDLLYQDSEFLKKMIQKKTESSNVNFQNHLNGYLLLHAISVLSKQWDLIETKLVKQLQVLTDKAQTFLDEYSCEFIHEPESYTTLISSTRSMNPFDNKGIDYSKIAKEVFDYANDTNKDFDRFYKAIYEKLIAYQKLHNEALLPLIKPNDFVASKDFVSKDDLDTSFLQQIEKWEIEIQKELLIEKKKKKPHKKSTHHSNQNRKVVSTKIRPVYQEDSDEDKEPISLPSAPATEDLTKASIQPPFEITPTKDQEKPLLNRLQETSPFQVHPRITNWFLSDTNSPTNVNVLNEESHLIHNFAWAANNILWKFGLHYKRKNDDGQYQPALAMLCQVEHGRYPQPQLFLVTMTFNHHLDENIQSNNNSNFTYNQAWTCYHRTLTRRDQNDNNVKEYINNGKYQFIDYPALPSQSFQMDFPEEFKKTYPDGSFIEKVDGLTITIRDPKNDVKDSQCRMHLFVVR